LSKLNSSVSHSHHNGVNKVHPANNSVNKTKTSSKVETNDYNVKYHS